LYSITHEKPLCYSQSFLLPPTKVAVVRHLQSDFFNQVFSYSVPQKFSSAFPLKVFYTSVKSKFSKNKLIPVHSSIKRKQLQTLKSSFLSRRRLKNFHSKRYFSSVQYTHNEMVTVSAVKVWLNSLHLLSVSKIATVVSFEIYSQMKQHVELLSSLFPAHP